MTRLADRLGLGERELISIVGGGGKSTLLFALGAELAGAGHRVVLTTTTKMGRNQAGVAPAVCWSADTGCVLAALEGPGPVMMLTGGDDHKITGPPPEAIDRLFAAAVADYVIVEADGSHGRPLKAPAQHEPVVPTATTTVAILMGIDAIGNRLDAAVHRVEVAERFTGLQGDHVLTAPDCAMILAHPEGALRACPPGSRVVVGITKTVTDDDKVAAGEVCRQVARHPRIGSCVLL